MPSGKPVFTNIKDKKIAIYASKGEREDYGEVLPTFEPISDTMLWASYHSLSGNQFYMAMTAGFTDEVLFTR